MFVTKKNYINPNNPENLIKLKHLALIIVLIFFVFVTCYSIYKYITFDPANNLRFPNVSSKVYDKNNLLIAEISADNSVKRTPIKFADIPKFCVEALVSVEDKTFFENIGIDAKGIIRLIVSIFSNGSMGGGSTISQQLIKNINDRIHNRTANDKLTEIIQAIKLNKVFTKEEILELYLNNIYFGNLNYGIESASIEYFNKSAKDLTDIECAYLMGIPQSPGIFNPKGDLELGIKRMYRVLLEMYKDKKIDLTKYTFLKSLDIKQYINTNPTLVNAPHFIEFFTNELKKERKDLYNEKIFVTNYNLSLHQTILKTIQDFTNNFDGSNNAAVVLIDKQGKLEVMIGSKNFFDDNIQGKYNAALGFRQPSQLYLDLIMRQEPLKKIKINEDMTITDQNFKLFLSNENIVAQIDPSVRSRCSEKLLLEGCEISLLDIVKSYYSIFSSKILKNQDLFFLANEPGEVRHNFPTISIFATDINAKDNISILISEHYLLGIWLGNSDGSATTFSTKQALRDLSEKIFNTISNST